MKKQTLAALFVSIAFLSLEMPLAYGFVLMTSGNDVCRLRNPMNILYFNDAAAVTQYQVPVAAEAWNDVPAFIRFSPTTGRSLATMLIRSVDNPELTTLGVGGRTYTSGTEQNPTIVCSNEYISTPIVIDVNEPTITNWVQQFAFG